MDSPIGYGHTVASARARPAGRQNAQVIVYSRTIKYMRERERSSWNIVSGSVPPRVGRDCQEQCVDVRNIQEHSGMWVIRPRRSQANLLVVYFITSNMAGSLEQNNDSSKFIWSSSGSLSLGAGTSHSELVASQTNLGYEVYTASEPNLTDLNHSSRSRENGTGPVAITDNMAVPRVFDIIAYRFYDPETTTLRLETPYSNYSKVSNVSQFPTSFHSRNTTRHVELEGQRNATYQEVARFGTSYLEIFFPPIGRKKRTVPLQKIEFPPQGITDNIALRHNQLNKLRRLNAIISHDTFPSTEVLKTSMKTTVTKLDKRSVAGSEFSSGSYYLGSEDTYLPEVVSLDHSSPKADRGNEMQVYDKLLLLDLPARTVRHPPFRYKCQTDKVPGGLSDDSSAPSALSDRSLLTHKDENHLKADPLSSRARRLGMIVKKSSEKVQGFSVQSSESVSKSNHSREHLSAVSAEVTQIIHSREHSKQDTSSGPIIGQHQINDTSSLIQEDMHSFPYATMMSSAAYATSQGTAFNQRDPPGFDEQYLDLGGPPVVIIQYFNPLFVDYELHSSYYPHVHAHNTKVVESGQSRSHKQRTHHTFSSERKKAE
uniref:Uncharacterized protein n=1 Tax=Timema monikensis TaxID=170555 RepID=A0A7R9EHM9_9NEOP|nr:unnamed protein product [Timema monikensis]